MPAFLNDWPNDYHWADSPNEADLHTGKLSYLRSSKKRLPDRAALFLIKSFFSERPP